MSPAVLGTDQEPSPAESEQIPSPVCVGFELLPWQSHGDPCSGTGSPTEKRPLEPSPMVSAQMPSPTVLGTEQDPSPVASEQMSPCRRPLPQGPNRSRRPRRRRWIRSTSPAASEQLPLPACEGFDLL